MLLLLCIPLAIAFRYILQEIIMDAVFGFTNYTEGYLLWDYFFDNLYYAFVFTSFGVIVYFLRYTRYKEQQQHEFEIENQKTQLALLKSQLNPHFLFNALNNIYALVYEKSEASLGALEKLSRLLRYSLYEKSELVSLEKEWHFIENYIELEQLRLPFKPAILLEVPTNLPAIKIPPFSLITFVENAFKHGELQNITHPLRIKMKLEKDKFIFSIENSINHNKKDPTGGIGLTNLQRRLAIFYQNEHELTIHKKDNLFSVTFKIPLSRC
ncbi:sensor histidine kinase [Lewinella sp. LCG006]|uniref:sensor histidine kinase n=1 Tax=Lewinella sp. LCG006 TaxID=3231911 RepID=UPI0034610441